MRIDFNGNKGFRLLSMYEMLNKGKLIKKAELVAQCNLGECFEHGYGINVDIEKAIL